MEEVGAVMVAALFAMEARMIGSTTATALRLAADGLLDALDALAALQQPDLEPAENCKMLN